MRRLHCQVLDVSNKSIEETASLVMQLIDKTAHRRVDEYTRTNRGTGGFAPVPYAAKSRDAIRDVEEAPDPLRTAFQRDRDRIIHSKCFRRLKHKTQVYIAPGDHYRTRMTHTLEVGQIGRTVARALRLNEDLVEAIAMGHDVGHTPFGHVGEYALRDMVGTL